MADSSTGISGTTITCPRGFGHRLQQLTLCTKNYLWYSEDTLGTWSTSHERMQPAFAGTRDTVAIPFGSRVVSTRPREHRRVVNGSFGDRFVEGIYLHMLIRKHLPYKCLISHQRPSFWSKISATISSLILMNFLFEIPRASLVRQTSFGKN